MARRSRPQPITTRIRAMTTTKKNTTAKKVPTRKRAAKKLSQIEAAQQVLAKASAAQL